MAIGHIKFLEGPLGLDKRVFDVSRDIVEHPAVPGHTLPPEIYMGCMVIEYLMRKIQEQVKGLDPGAYFVCPQCRDRMSWNIVHLLWDCRRCGCAVTEAALSGLVQHGVLHGTSSYNPKPPDEKDYEPRLTSPIPRGMDIEKIQKIQENAKQEEEPVVMYRAWKLQMPDYSSGDPIGSMLLRSINNALWEPRHPLRAVHWPGGFTHDEDDEHVEIKGGCPNWNCNCGIYAVKTLAQAQKWNKTSPPMPGGRALTSVQVLGKVVLWGKVLMFETGAKAQYAYPEQLWLSPTMLEWGACPYPDRVVEELSAKYGIPVDLEDGMFDLGLTHT